MKGILEKESRIIILLVIIVLITFLYGCYKIENIAINEIQMNICYIILTMLCILSFIFSLYFYSNKNIKPEKAFLIIVPLFCILLTLAMPMSKGHDETIHALRIYEYAEGKFISNGEKAYLEEGVINAIDNKPTYLSLFNSEKTYDTNTQKIEWGYRISSSSPINYLPQVVGIMLGRVITTNSMIHVYIARLANIIACTAMLYLAIKLIPYGKNIIFLLCIIPIAIEGFSTLSADGFLIASSFLFISYILKLKEEKDKKITKKEIFILSILAIIIALSKTIYILILPLLLLLPKEKFKNNVTKIIFVAIICLISSILDIGWYIIGVQRDAFFIQTGDNPIAYIISNPIEYLQKIIYTLMVYSSKYIEEIFGGKLEWNEAVTIHLFPTILLIISAIITALGKTKVKWKIWERLLLIITIISSIIMIFTSMFLVWSEIEIDVIEGIQGRYFLPIIPLIFLLIGRFLDDSKTTRIISIVALIMQIYVIMELVLYHI